MSRREEASKLNSENIGRRKRVRPLPQASTCQFAMLRLALPGVPSTAVLTGNLTNAVLSLGGHYSQNHPLMAGDAIPMGLSEIRK